MILQTSDNNPNVPLRKSRIALWMIWIITRPVDFLIMEGNQGQSLENVNYNNLK